MKAICLLMMFVSSLTAFGSDDFAALPSYEEFDQTPGKGWRALADQKRFNEAAWSIQTYLAGHKELKVREKANLHFHAAQCLAIEGSPKSIATALAHLQDARVNPESADSHVRWNDYVAATEAFLKGDLSSLKAARARIAEGPKWNGEVANLDVVDRLVAKFGKPYADAYLDDRKESLAVLAKIAASFEVRLDETRKAKFDDKPAMRWTNTIGHATDAAMFFWMHDGRPVAVGTTFTTDGVIGHEFQSLALQPFQTRRGEKTVWQPREPGIQFESLKGAPAPAETARQRLTQIKTLARRFRAEAIKGPPAYQENDVYQLRLLAQPILRYQDPKVPELEGAVFVFAMDTDADVLLLIENRVRDGKGNWEYAFARTNPFALKAWCDDTQVWSQERVQTIDPDLPYFNITIGPFPRKEN
ncbi:MAG: hypothetical protein IAG10_13500 [Planctomycetaceae bacterium]|nr:hypothetical protein [Planctomycetaceae bacterium]